MELTDEQRERFSTLTWMEPDPALDGFEELRPLSLGSHAALNLIGSPLFLTDTPLDHEIERGQVSLYIALHARSLKDVLPLFWDGSWPALAACADEITDAMLHQFRLYRERCWLALHASAVGIKPRGGKSTTPPGVIGVVDLSFKAALLSQGDRSRGSLQSLIWHTWLPQALQLYHADLRWNGAWTVRPGRQAKNEEVSAETLTPDWLEPSAFEAPPFDTPATV